VEDEYGHLSNLGVATSALAPIGTVAGTIYQSYAKIILIPTFVSLTKKIGLGSFALVLDGSMRAGLTTANYEYNWANGNSSICEYWSANLTSGVISGPLTFSQPFYRATINDEVNWAGWSFWGPSTPYLNSVNMDLKWPTVTTDSTAPQNVPSGDSVDQDFSAWNSLTDSSGNLWQAGWYRDASRPGSGSYGGGQPFAQFWCPNPTPGCPDGEISANTSAAGAAKVGDIVNELIEWSGVAYKWDASLDDYTSGNISLTTVDVQPFLSGGYHPLYTNEIVEPPAFSYSYGIVTQQIAKFAQVNFYDINLCVVSSGPCYHGLTAYDDGDYNIYQLNQACASWFLGIYGGICNGPNDNTNQVYNDASGGYWDESGYPDVTWVNSIYDYNCVTDQDPCN
jgi:hypothetical protein